jgi:hypothetical protein
MTYTKQAGFCVSEIKKSYTENRKRLIMRLSSFFCQKLPQDYLSEIDAKNRAYYFIIESGNINNFHEYCKMS